MPREPTWHERQATCYSARSRHLRCDIWRALPPHQHRLTGRLTGRLTHALSRIATGALSASGRGPVRRVWCMGRAVAAHHTTAPAARSRE